MANKLSIISPQLSFHTPGFVMSGTLHGSWGRFRGVLRGITSGKIYHPTRFIPPPNWLLQFGGFEEQTFLLEIKRGLFGWVRDSYHVDLLLQREDITAIEYPATNGVSICPSNFAPWGMSNREGATVTGTLKLESTGKATVASGVVTNGIWSLQYSSLKDGSKYSLSVTDGGAAMQRVHLLAANASC